MIRRLAGVIALTLSAATLASCADSSAPSASTTRTTSAPHSSSASTTTAPREVLDDRLVTDLEEIASAHPGAEVSVALAPVGTGSAAEIVGEAPALVAWSTIKVPLALAVIRSGAAGPTASDPDINAALTASDNAAAARLWQRLGSGERAASAVEDQLRRGGDSRTELPPEVTVAGFSPFGQATWRLRDQVRFTATLPCLTGSAEVTGNMGRVVDGQRWGLGTIEAARYKGGWGSTPQGYVVRQMGLLHQAKGRTAAAVQVRTGTHGQGTGIVTEVARVLEEHAQDLPTGSCD